MRVLVLLALLAPSLQEKTHPKILAVRGAKIYPGTEPPLEHGVLLVEDGKIQAVGKDLPIPPEALVVEAAGKVIVPGLIDAASRLFLEPQERTPGSAEQRVLDALDRTSDLYLEAVAEGVTTVYVGSPSTGSVNGLGAVLRLDRPRTVLLRDAALKVSVGVAAGEASSPAQRYESYREIRQAFEAARQYGETWIKYRRDLSEWEQKKPQEADKKPAKPRTDPRSEILLRALDVKQPLTVRLEAHTLDAIALAVRLAEEYKLSGVLEGATEARHLAETLRKASLPVVAGPVIRSGPPGVDQLHHTLENAAELARGGVVLAIGSFGEEPGGATRFLADSAALAASGGMTREQALAAITIDAAKVVGIAKTHGSLEKGKAADFVLLSGEPFERSTTVERTIMDGKTVYARKEEDR